MKKLKNIFIRDIFIITRSPEQYQHEFNTEEQIRELSEYDGGMVVFVDMSDDDQKAIDPFFTRGKRKDLEVYCLSQS